MLMDWWTRLIEVLRSLRYFWIAGESIQASHNHPEGRAICPPSSHPRVHVRRGGERRTGSTAGLPQNRWAAESQRPGWSATCGQEGEIRWAEESGSPSQHTHNNTTKRARKCQEINNTSGCPFLYTPPPSFTPCFCLLFSLLTNTTLRITTQQLEINLLIAVFVSYPLVYQLSFFFFYVWSFLFFNGPFSS